MTAFVRSGRPGWRLRTANPLIAGGPDPSAVIQIRDRLAAHAEGPAPTTVGAFASIYTISAFFLRGSSRRIASTEEAGQHSMPGRLAPTGALSKKRDSKRERLRVITCILRSSPYLASSPKHSRPMMLGDLIGHRGEFHAKFMRLDDPEILPT